MSAITLERIRIRMLKELLRQGFAARSRARSLFSASSALHAAGSEWRRPEILRDDWPGMPATSRFLREAALRLPRAGHALSRFLNRLESDERRLQHMLIELANCLGVAHNPRTRAEFSIFWAEVCPEGPPAEEIITLITAGKRPLFTSPPVALQVSSAAP